MTAVVEIDVIGVTVPAVEVTASIERKNEVSSNHKKPNTIN